MLVAPASRCRLTEVAQGGYDDRAYPEADLGVVFGEDAHSAIAVNVRAPGQHGADTDCWDRNEIAPHPATRPRIAPAARYLLDAMRVQ